MVNVGAFGGKLLSCSESTYKFLLRTVERKEMQIIKFVCYV